MEFFWCQMQETEWNLCEVIEDYSLVNFTTLDIQVGLHLAVLCVIYLSDSSS
jgi:hypothetical protein